MNTNEIGTPVQPGKENVPDVKELLAAVTDENLHPEVDTGEPVGEEIW